MNPDPNQPQPQPAPAPTPAPTPEVTPVAPAPYASAPVVDPTPAPAPVVEPTPAPNPFGAAPVAPVTNPFGPATPVSSDQPTPVGFAAPTTIGSSPNNNPLPAAGNPKKKLIILISAIVGGLILIAGIALAAYFMFFYISKADYQKAYDQMNIVKNKYNAGDATSSSASSADTIAAAKTSYEEFKTESAKLSDLKALRNDKDLKAKYDVYAKKEVAYVKFGDAFLPSIEAFTTASTEASDLSSGSSASYFSSANVQKTIDIYTAAKDKVTYPALKTYLETAIAVYTEALPNARIYESSTSSSSEKLKAITAISTTFRKLSTAASTMGDAITAETKDISLTDSLNDLGKAVTAKLNDHK